MMYTIGDWTGRESRSRSMHRRCRLFDDFDRLFDDLRSRLFHLTGHQARGSKIGGHRVLKGLLQGMEDAGKVLLPRIHE